jgi:hypothetical protein
MDPEGKVLAMFIADFHISPEHPTISRGYLDGLDTIIFTEANSHPEVVQAAKLLAFASFGMRYQRPTYFKKAQVMYIDMLRSLRIVISKDTIKNKVELLIIIVLLGLYEMIAGTDNHSSSHASHTSGVYGLLSCDSNPFGLLDPDKRLRIPVNTPFKGPIALSDQAGVFSFPWVNGSEQSLDALLVKNKPLFTRAASLLNTRTTLEGDLQELKQEAKLLDEEISRWPNSVPKEWAPTTVGTIGTNRNDSIADLTWISDRVDSYLDLFVAATWNVYRKTRLLLLDIVVRCSSRLGEKNACFSEKAQAQEISDDIMASLPFHLLRDAKRFVEESEIMPGRTVGGLFAMYGLFLMANLSVVPQHQHIQARACLLWIGEWLGIGQARLLSNVRQNLIAKI